MTRQEINHIAQKKQEEVMKVIREADRPISIREAANLLPMDYEDVRRQFENLRIKKKTRELIKWGTNTCT